MRALTLPSASRDGGLRTGRLRSASSYDQCREIIGIRHRSEGAHVRAPGVLVRNRLECGQFRRTDDAQHLSQRFAKVLACDPVELLQPIKKQPVSRQTKWQTCVSRKRRTRRGRSPTTNCLFGSISRRLPDWPRARAKLYGRARRSVPASLYAHTRRMYR